MEPKTPRRRAGTRAARTHGRLVIWGAALVAVVRITWLAGSASLLATVSDWGWVGAGWAPKGNKLRRKTVKIGSTKRSIGSGWKRGALGKIRSHVLPDTAGNYKLENARSDEI
jgi:hypothetical protein